MSGPAFCCYHASHSSCATAPATLGLSASPVPAQPDVPVPETGARKKISEENDKRPRVSWPLALRAVRGWLEPWIMLRRYWHGWSQQLPPPALQLLLRQLEQGQPIALYRSA